MSASAPTAAQAAMIYLADSIAGFRHAQEETNRVLRELLALSQLGAAQSNTNNEDEPDDISGLARFMTQNPAQTAPK